MAEKLSTAWGYLLSAPWADLGTHVWAEFPIPSGSPTPQHLAAYVFTDLHNGDRSRNPVPDLLTAR